MTDLPSAHTPPLKVERQPSSLQLPRNRWRYTVAFLVLLVAGLPTRLIPVALPPFVVSHVGDALWAMAIFLGLGWLLPRSSTRRLVLLALALTWTIEFTQFIQADFLNQLRQVKFFALILGFTFLPSDLVMYTLGILAGAACERWVLRQAT